MPTQPPATHHAVRIALLAALLSLLAALVAPPASATTGADGQPVPDPLSAPGLLVPDGVPAPPQVPAGAWLVADLDTGAVLAARDATVPLAPASTLKILTALALGRQLDPSATYTAAHDDAAVDGSKVGLVPGSVYTVDDLLHGLMLGSGNDAASALANLSGGPQQAAKSMQAEAERLGATGTVVRNPSGLDADGQVSTARDLALFGRAALDDERLAALVATRTYQFPGKGTAVGAGRPHFQIANHNRLLGSYPGALGVKNGYTVAAGGSFVGAVERDGHRYVVVLLRTQAPTWRHARDLLDWAIANAAAATPVGELQPAGTEPSPPAGQRGSSGAAHPRTNTAAAGVEPVDTAVAGLGTGGLPLWLQVPLAVVALLVMAVVALRTRVLVRRRRRRQAHRASRLSRDPSATGGASSGPPPQRP